MAHWVWNAGTALISVVALGVSARSCQVSSNVARYQNVSNALSGYSEAFQNLDNALRRPHLQAVFGRDPAAEILGATEGDFDQYYKKAEPTLNAYDAYTTAVNKVREPWSDHINNQIIRAGTTARVAVMCYLTLQSWVENREKANFADTKRDALRWCSDPEKRRKDFEDSSNQAIKDMTTQVSDSL